MKIIQLIKIIVLVVSVECSEFPERECCDPIYPNPDPEPSPPSQPTSNLPSSPASPLGRSGMFDSQIFCTLKKTFQRHEN